MPSRTCKESNLMYTLSLDFAYFDLKINCFDNNNSFCRFNYEKENK
jgi:hypothetical protein